MSPSLSLSLSRCKENKLRKFAARQKESWVCRSPPPPPPPRRLRAEEDCGGHDVTRCSWKWSASPPVVWRSQLQMNPLPPGPPRLSSSGVFKLLIFLFPDAAVAGGDHICHCCRLLFICRSITQDLKVPWELILFFLYHLWRSDPGTS